MVFQGEHTAFVHVTRFHIARIPNASASENTVRKRAKDGLSRMHVGRDELSWKMVRAITGACSVESVWLVSRSGCTVKGSGWLSES